MIKITKGTVGVVIDGRNTTRSYEDDAFSLDKETEARFVKLGVAGYYSTGTIGPETGGSKAPSQQSVKSAETYESAEEETDKDDDTLESMSFPALRNLAKQMRLSASGKREDIIARINEANKVEM